MTLESVRDNQWLLSQQLATDRRSLYVQYSANQRLYSSNARGTESADSFSPSTILSWGVVLYRTRAYRLLSISGITSVHRTVQTDKVVEIMVESQYGLHTSTRISSHFLSLMCEPVSAVDFSDTIPGKWISAGGISSIRTVLTQWSSSNAGARWLGQLGR